MRHLESERGVSYFLIKIPEITLDPFLPRDNQQESRSMPLGRMSSPKPELAAQHTHLTSSASRTMRNAILWYISFTTESSLLHRFLATGLLSLPRKASYSEASTALLLGCAELASCH